MKTFPIIFFDCDGVLIFDEPYLRLNRAAKIPEELDRQWFNDYYDGILPFTEWIKRQDAYYLENNLTFEMLRDILKNFTFNPEAFEIIKYLKTQNIKTAIISSGIDYYVEQVAKKLEIDYWRANSHMIFDRDGKFIKTGFLKEDEGAKVENVKEICDNLGIDPRNTMFIGDSANDLKAFEFTKHGVLYKTNNKDYEKYAWKKINNLNKIKDLINL